jgi:hypothetical protein
MSSLLSLKALNLDNNGMFAIKENVFSKLLGLHCERSRYSNVENPKAVNVSLSKLPR